MGQQREIPSEMTVWTSHKLPPTGRNNIEDMLKRSRFPDGVVYGFVSLYSPREQDTTMYVGSQARGKGLAQWDFDLRKRISFWLGWTITKIFSQSH